ncbi:MAG: ABC transporter substrate-binding protein, partial [Thaumarchaeota archaeon]|nr:ABC transporter substrate-binding protein [Nitrososphaerota archaeon]
VSFQNSVDLAVSQMNANLTAAGSNIQFAVVHSDDGGTGAGALSSLQSEFQSAGVQVVIGPLTSGEVLATVQYATQKHIVVLPGAATATALIGVSPYVFRPGQPGDQLEGTSIAKSIIQTGQKNAVFLYRDDPSEAGTYNISSKILLAAGFGVQGIALPPLQADYAAQVQAANTAVGQYLSSGGTTSNTAVAILDGGTEAQNVFQHAATSSNLGTVRWYGIESLAGHTLLASAAGPFMAQVNLTISAPQNLNSPHFTYFNTTYTAKFGGPPEPYSGYFYDNAWIAMLSTLAAGSYSGDKIIAVLPTVADHFFGASSTSIWLVNHDQSIGFYDILKCAASGGASSFIKIGTYNGQTGDLILTGK